MKARIEEKTVASLCRIVASGGTPLRSNEAFWENGNIPWLKTGELKDTNIYSAEEAITTEGLEQSSAKLFPENTILMAMYGDGRTITSLGRLKTQIATNQACCAMVVDEEICDKDYFFYLLKNERHRLLSLVVAGAQRNLSLGIIKNFQLPVLPKMDQKKIGGCLRAYDDLIENNRRRIALLEEAARLLYREWFVHFRFPGAEHVKIVDGVPEEWQSGTLEDVVVLQRGFDLPVAKRKLGDTPVIGSTGIVGFHDTPKVTNPIVTTGRSGSLGKVSYQSKPSWPLNTSLWSRKIKSSSIFYILFLLREMNLSQYNGGVSVPTLDRKVIHRIPARIPPEELLKEFDLVVAPMFKQIEFLQEQCQNLAKARDLLLPRLMDGRLEI